MRGGGGWGLQMASLRGRWGGSVSTPFRKKWPWEKNERRGKQSVSDLTETDLTDTDLTAPHPGPALPPQPRTAELKDLIPNRVHSLGFDRRRHLLRAECQADVRVTHAVLVRRKQVLHEGGYRGGGRWKLRGVGGWGAWCRLCPPQANPERKVNTGVCGGTGGRGWSTCDTRGGGAGRR